MKLKIASISIIIVIAAVSAYFVTKKQERTITVKCDKTECSFVEKNGLDKIFNEKYFKTKEIMQCHVEPIYLNAGTTEEKIETYELFLHFYQDNKISLQNADGLKLAKVCEGLANKEDFSYEYNKEDK